MNHSRVAPNVEFLVDDAEDEWIGSSYDFIHIRMLSGAIKDWPKLLANAFKHLNPGGWIEVCEFEVWMSSNNDSMSQAPDIQQWQKGLNDAGAQIGRRMDVAANLEEWLRGANFADIVQRITKVPVGTWPKDKHMKTLGAYQLLNLLDATSSYGQAHFTRVLGWSVSEYEVLGARIRTQLKQTRFEFYSNLYVFIRTP